MIKRIFLISLFLFMPFVSHAYHVVLGDSVENKNIPLNVDVVEWAFYYAFNDTGHYDTSKTRFLYVLQKQADNAFSMKDLYDICIKTTFQLGETIEEHNSKCQNFVKYYISGLSGDSIDYNGHKIKMIDKESKEKVWEGLLNKGKEAVDNFKLE